jgi:glycosyltransferase involved in cell wall biosynthesis
MPELSVSMPTHNAGRFIGEAIESVLAQEGVDFELLIVNDGSTDNTLDVIQTYLDTRIRLFTNTRKRGIACCHNRVIAESQSPYIAHVDSDDIVAPGALQKVLEAIKVDDSIGQVHCHFYDIDEFGKISEEDCRVRRQKFQKSRPLNMDYRYKILVSGNVINHLRTYKKEIFQTLGTFNENLKRGIDLEMAIRIVDKFRIQLVPEYLYYYRIHSANTTRKRRFQRFWYLLERYWMCRRLLDNGSVHFMQEDPYDLNKLMLESFRNLLPRSRSKRK